jgi:anti-sigma regulatory factor (Ser/Thr protein kinase)
VRVLGVTGKRVSTYSINTPAKVAAIFPKPSATCIVSQGRRVRQENDGVGATVSVRALIDRLGATGVFGLRAATQGQHRRPPRVLVDRLDLNLPADPLVLQHIRRAFRRFAQDLGLDQERSEGLLVAVGEAASNAIEHAYLGSQGRIFLRARLDGPTLVVEIEDRGRWRRSGDRHGHGLELMRALTDSVSVDATAAGTTVRFTVSLPNVS